MSLVMCSLFSTFGCSNSETHVQDDSYYKLSYYDGNDATLGYNNNLFYQNDVTKAGPDPSVVYGKGSDGKDYFYVFPTGNMKTIYAYRSTNLADWNGVGYAFVPEKNSWAQSVMWAPDVIYDAEADDGQGGKGLYYLFFTAADSVRGNEKNLYFDSRVERYEYWDIASQVNAMNDNQAISALSYTNFNTKVQELCNTYGISNSDQVSYLLGLYTANVKNESDVAVKGSYARETILSIRIADMHTVGKNSQGSYAGIVATAKTLDGPFIQYTNDGTDGNRAISIKEPFFTHEDLYANFASKYSIDKCINIVDLHPFVDPETGDKYMYFNSNPLAPHSVNSVAEIFVVKVGDKNARWTDDWQWETAKQLTRTGYVDMGENENPKKTDAQSDLGESAINEGAYMIYNEDNGKYYLTISKGNWDSSNYAIIQAVGDSPMGPFKKFSRAEGGILLQTETQWIHTIGPGHHSFIKHQDKTYIVYHKHMKQDASGDRAFAVDEIKWIKNSSGEQIMYCNGPSVTPQLKMDSGYRNVMDKATVSVTSGENKNALTDGLVSATSELSFVKEYSVENGNATITIDFGAYRTIRGLMIYNSREYDKAFKQIDRIEFDFAGEKDGQTVQGTAFIDNLKFNENYFYELYGENYVIPASAATAEFDEMLVKTIRIVLDSKKATNISEIIVFGK